VSTSMHAPTGGDTDAPVTDEVLDRLRSRVAGQVVTPQDPEFDRERAVWNGMIDRHPGAIVRCAGVDDVVTTIGTARDHGLLLAVRGGGHNVSGNAVCDGGLVLDLSAMRQVEVDPATRTVRAAGGATIGDVDRATQPHGLAVPLGVVSETGIAGLTLSGGLGWLRRRFGTSADNLVAAEVVTADGRVLHTSAEEEPELFWALRGGGGNLGVVTSFEFRAHPVGPEVTFGLIFHAGDDAPEALAAFHRWAADAPDGVSTLSVLWHLPALEELPAAHHGRPGLTIAALHPGPADVAERELASLRAIGRPLADLTSTTSYLEAQSFFDEDYPAHELRYYWKSRYLTGLDDDAIRRLVDLNERAPSHHSTLDLWQIGGAMARVPADATAFGDRSAPYLLGIEANWEDAADDEANLAWAREAYATMDPHASDRQYLNFPGFHEEGERAMRATFGANYDRLVEAKTTYDPTNLFRLNANIRPR
jgi:FAD/FMN-containing dehydrogenase